MKIDTPVPTSILTTATDPSNTPEGLTESVRRHYRIERAMQLQHLRCIDGSKRTIFNIKGNALGYFPVPKNATTSIKFSLAEIFGHASDYDDYEDIPWHQHTRLGCMPIRFKTQDTHYTVLCGYPRTPIHEFLPARPFKAIAHLDIRLCVLRDPVDRCISMYSNRILFHREREAESFDAFLDHLPDYGKRSMNFLPQHWFLGDDLGYYTHIFSMREIGRLTQFLSDLSGIALQTRKRQTGGGREKPTISSAQRRRVRTMFAKDYDLIGDYL